jgi:23S rRNA pseudouridine1911/1915/1917 synthase
VKIRHCIKFNSNVKEENGVICTFIARSKKDGRKQKVYLVNESHPESAREAITEYKVLKDYEKYTLLEVQIKTGRRHQIRCVFSHLHHPVAGDKLYGFKNSKKPAGLTRQFLHSAYLKIQLPNGKKQEFTSELPEDLKKVIDKYPKEAEAYCRGYVMLHNNYSERAIVSTVKSILKNEL